MIIIMHSNHSLYSIAVGIILLSIFYFETSSRYLWLLILIVLIITGCINYALSAQVKRREAEIVLSLNQAQIQARCRRRNFIHSRNKKSIPEVSDKHKNSPLNPWGITGNPTSVRKKSVIRISPLAGSETHRLSPQNDRAFSSDHKAGFTAEVLSSFQNQSNYQHHYELGSFPTINLNKTPLPSLSLKNTSMVHSPITVKIAPPEKNGNTSLRFDFLNENPMERSTVNSVVTALQSCRKRPKAVTEEMENKTKRQRRDSTSSTGSAFTSMNSKNSDGIFNGMLRNTSNISSPMYPVKESCILSQKRSFIENNDCTILKRFKNNEIFSSYSSSRKLLKQKRKRNSQPTGSSKISKLSSLKQNTLNIITNSYNKEIISKNVEALEPLPHPSLSDSLLTDDNDNNDSKKSLNPELSSSHPDLPLLEGLSRKRQLALYTSLDGFTFSKPLYVSESNTNIDDIKKDKEASEARLQELLSRVNNVFDAKDKKIKQNLGNMTEIDKNNSYEIKSTPVSLSNFNTSSSSKFIMSSPTTSTNTTTTTICSTSSSTLLTTSTCTVPSSFSSNSFNENHAASKFFQSNDLKSSSVNDIISNSPTTVSMPASSTITDTVLSKLPLTNNSEMVSAGMNKEPQQHNSNVLFVAKTAEKINSEVNEISKENSTVNAISNQKSASSCFNLSSTTILPAASLSFSTVQNENTAKPAANYFSPSTFTSPPTEFANKFLTSASLSQPSLKPPNGKFTFGISQASQNVLNTSVTNTSFQDGKKTLFPNNITNKKEDYFLENTDIKSNTLKGNAFVIKNQENPKSEIKLSLANDALVASPSITTKSIMTNSLQNSFLPNVENLKKTNESSTIQTSFVPVANHSLMSPSIPLTSPTTTTGFTAFTGSQNSSVSSMMVNSFPFNFGMQSNNSDSSSVKLNQITPTFQFGNPPTKDGGFNFGLSTVPVNSLNNTPENKINTQQGLSNEQNSSKNTAFNFGSNSSGLFSKENSSTNVTFNFSGASPVASSTPFEFGNSPAAGGFKFNLLSKTDSTSSSSNRRPLQARRRMQQRH